MFAAYASSRGRALVDRELYLPKSWTSDLGRCAEAKIPDERAFATKGDLAKAVIMRALASPLPIAWVTADSAYAQEWRLRRMPEKAGVGYVLAVPKSQHAHAIGRIDFAITQAPEDAWERHSCGAGAKGPRVYDWAAARLPVIDEFDGDAATMNDGCWPARTRSPTTLLMRWPAPPSPSCYGSPGRAGRSRRLSRPRRTSAAWTSTKSAGIRAGTGTSHWPCLPTPSLLPWPPRGRKGGRRIGSGDLVPLTVAEIRRLLSACRPTLTHIRHTHHALNWSRWRHRHQATARRCHYRRRTRSHELPPPDSTSAKYTQEQAPDQHK
ncbi:transposase [Streptomyces chartreusis]|uniref:transposase n=1 Tax=Streptomyces chartreusis TaxID=1969 RepID=UPI0036B073C9